MYGAKLVHQLCTIWYKHKTQIHIEWLYGVKLVYQQSTKYKYKKNTPDTKYKYQTHICICTQIGWMCGAQLVHQDFCVLNQEHLMFPTLAQPPRNLSIAREDHCSTDFLQIQTLAASNIDRI